MDPSTMSIKELKQVLVNARVPIPSGIEKSELIDLAKTAIANRPKADSIFPRVNYSGADIKNCSAIFVFFHGYGANEHQFAMFQSVVDPTVAIVCPKSPEEGWWPLDVADWAFALQSGRLLDKIKECPRGLKQIREGSLRFVEDLRKQAPPSAKLLLGGFSQGGVMAMDVALSMSPEISINVASFSSFIVDMGHWIERAKLHSGNIRALITHGKTDPLIPFTASEMLSSLLRDAGANVQFESHTGGHTLGDDRIIKACADFFGRTV